MSSIRLASYRPRFVAPVALFLSLACHATEQGGTPPSPQAGGKSFPAGSENAVAAARQALPGAVVTNVSAPKDFGADAADGSPLFWVVNLTPADKPGAAERSLHVTPDGIVILLPREIEEHELPRPVADSVAKAAAGGKVLHRERQETRATLAYAALAAPEVSYVVRVENAGHLRRMELAPDGRTLSSHDLGSAKSEEEEKSAAPAAAVPGGDGDYPAEASRAVQAVKQILPHVTIKGVEEVGYLDGTGRMSVLNYEVEFYEDGVEKEWNATPDGIVINVPRPVDATALPAAVREAATKEAGAKIRASVKQETRAGLKFVALREAKVIYAIEFEHGGKTVKSKWNPDGSRVEEIDPAALLGGKAGTSGEGGAGEKHEEKKP